MSTSPEHFKNADGGIPPAAANSMWRQAAFITLGAAAIYAGMRALPTGTNLHSGDFRVAGTGALELCDPANPQFVPVIAARSPVTMTVAPAPGGGGKFRLRLATSTEKPVGPAELLEVHTKKLHLLIVDPTLTHYQHVHPDPTASTGEWSFVFAPRRGGTYRVFADFTPVVTGRSLYASADIPVMESQVERGESAALSGTETNTAQLASPAWPEETWRAEREGLVLQLEPAARPVRAGQSAEFVITLARSEGGAVALEPVMGALAHLVAFDDARAGFAHLHPNPVDGESAKRFPASAAAGTAGAPLYSGSPSQARVAM